jgi:hypothetical protein
MKKINCSLLVSALIELIFIFKLTNRLLHYYLNYYVLK